MSTPRNLLGAKILVHWLEKSRAQRILHLLEELSLPYEIKAYSRNPNGTAPDALKTIHPLGKSPLVSITPPPEAQKGPIVLAESGPIIEYLLSHSGEDAKAKALVPEQWKKGEEGELGGETEAWMRYRYWMHYAEGSLMSPVQVHLIMNAVENAPVPFFLKPLVRFVPGRVRAEFLDQELKTHFRFLESQLETAPEGGPFFCGSRLTAADIQMSIPVLAGLNLSIVPRKEYPRLDAFSTALQKTEGYQRAVRKIEELEGKPFVAI
ncbi:glutathione S-transferase [Aspergillus alliaceus]|uniref:Glutathione S-transferase n=1 Tax=Petromyces alliaceus TaxID=209559 RepID=A0A5N7BWM8_PETAA|nr:glutathione S-transferase [Aspergillus alliaceus]